MATSHEATVKNERYKNWIKSGLALKYLKEGLQPFVTDVIKQQHERIVGSFLSCNTCSLRTLLPHHAAKVGRNCSLGRAKCLCIGSKHTIRTPCPTNVCGEIYDKIVDSHYYGDPNLSNTDITKWVADPWEFAKAYINAWGYKDQTSAEDTDCLGLLSIIINNMEFHIFTTTMDTFIKVRQYRNEIMHSSNLEVTDANLNTYVTDMDTILDDPTRLRNEHFAQEARTKLQKLLKNDIYISTTDEIYLIREAQRSLERNNNMQADRLHNIVQSLGQMKEENQDRFEGIDKAQDSLKKAIDDMNNKSIDQQKLASDLQQVRNDLESMNREAKLDRKSMTDRIVIIENSLKEIDSLLKEMVSENQREKEDKKYKEQLEYLEKKNALKVRLFEIYEMHFSTVPISPILEEMQSHIGEIYVDVVICDHLFKEVGDIRCSRAIRIDCEDNKVKNYEDIFIKNGQRCLNTYMLGDAGMGKTTWCMKLVNDWVNCSRDWSIQTEKLKGILLYEVIILVFLRNATEEVKIIDMIKEQLFSEDTELYEIFVNVLRKEPDKCLVVVDGLDEWIMPQVTKSLTQNKGIPSKAGLNGCPLLITTRPSKLYDIRLKENQFDRCIKIEAVKDKDELAEKLIKELNKLHDVNVPMQFSDFKKSYEGLSPIIFSDDFWSWNYRGKNPVTDCTDNPLLLIILVCIWFQYGKIEKTLAGNYSDMFRYLFEYAHNMKQINLKIPIPGQESNDSSTSKLLPECLNEKIPPQFVELMLKLSKFAFEILFNDSEIYKSKLVFAEKELNSWFTNVELQAAVDCGILSKSYAINQPLTRMTSMSFLHKSFQEFLSAVHIAGQFQNENETPMKMFQKSMRRYAKTETENTLLFVCGLDPRAASKMSLYFSHYYYGGNDLSLKFALNCTLQVNKFSQSYPSTKYPIYIERLVLWFTDNTDYSNVSDYLYCMVRSNINNIKHIDIRSLSTFPSRFEKTDTIMVKNVLSYELPLLLKNFSLQGIDLSSFSTGQLITLGKSLGNLLQLESLQLVDIRLPCTFKLYLQNCRQLKTMKLSDINLIGMKANVQKREIIKVQNVFMTLSLEDDSMLDVPIYEIVLSLSDKQMISGNSSNESEYQINGKNMLNICIEKFHKASLKYDVSKTCFAQVKHSKLQRKDLEHLVKVLRDVPIFEIQDLELYFTDNNVNTCNDDNLNNQQEIWAEILQFCKVPALVLNINQCSQRESNPMLHSLKIFNATVLEAEFLLKYAVSTDRIKSVYVSTEIIEHRLVLDLISCKHLEELEIRVSGGQFQLEDILNIAQPVEKSMTLQDNRVGFSLNRHALTCSNTNKIEEEIVTSFVVKNQDIREFKLSTESVEYQTLASLIACDHLNRLEMSLSNNILNETEAKKIIKRFECSRFLPPCENGHHFFQNMLSCKKVNFAAKENELSCWSFS